MTLEQTSEEHREAAPGSKVLLSLRGIHKRWGDHQVLADARLELEPGTVSWLGGRNGAGKTTLLRIASGLIAPDTGEVSLDGLDPDRDRRAYQSRTGFLSAGNLGLYARLTVTDNLDFFSRIALIPASERGGAIERATERFALAELADGRADRLSTGQRQRVRLAITFLHDPDVVLLDEPHMSLDEEATALVRAALADLTDRGGAAVWCSPTHGHGELGYDRGYRIQDGLVIPE